MRLLIAFIYLFAVLNLQAQNFENIDIVAASVLIGENTDNPAFTILDVRTEGEYTLGHLEGAFIRDFYVVLFEPQMDSLNKERIYLIYCKSGNRSGQTLAIMENLGFETVYNMSGGMDAWSAASYPVSTSLPEFVDLTAPLEVNTSINKVDKTSTVVYPNPASIYLDIIPADEAKILKIISITGEIVEEKLIQNNRRIDIEHLPDGSYLLVFFADRDVLLEVKQMFKN